MKKFPHYKQLDAMDCGPTCLRMIAKHYGKHYSLETLRQKCFIGREGVSMLGISTAKFSHLPICTFAHLHICSFAHFPICSFANYSYLCTVFQMQHDNEEFWLI